MTDNHRRLPSSKEFKKQGSFNQLLEFSSPVPAYPLHLPLCILIGSSYI